jgi:hypothetical protein
VATLKQKGDLAELKVAADLIDRGCRLSIPFGEDCDYDLIADYEGRLHRVQVKYTQSNGQVVVLRCRSHSLTKGKVRATKLYTVGHDRLDRGLRRHYRTLLLLPLMGARDNWPSSPSSAVTACA